MITSMNRNTTQEDLKASVEDVANKYPQYVGYTNGWNETIALRDKSTKGGLVMLAGDVVLVDGNTFANSIASTDRFGEGRKSAIPFVRVWSARRECPVWVEKSYLSS